MVDRNGHDVPETFRQDMEMVLCSLEPPLSSLAGLAVHVVKWPTWRG